MPQTRFLSGEPAKLTRVSKRVKCVHKVAINLPFVSVSKLNAKSLLHRKGDYSAPWSSSSDGVRTQTSSSLAEAVPLVL